MARRKGAQLLVPVEQYLSAGVHIGTPFRTKDMSRFIYRVRPDRLAIFDIMKIDERLRIAGRFLSYYEPEEIVVVARRKYAQHAAKKFAEVIGATPIVGRFVPGTFTNPYGKEFVEAGVVLVSDPIADREAILEAARARIPVVAFANSGNTVHNIDLVIPGNNRGRKSLALMYWILAREYMLNRGMIESRDKFPVKLEEFEG